MAKPAYNELLVSYQMVSVKSRHPIWEKKSIWLLKFVTCKRIWVNGVLRAWENITNLEEAMLIWMTF